ncbi:outer membrane lipoprotein carrier protein LolA [Ectothiorhodospiraceae bacterium BW-2]|nr:outer membrane lipoprotein carrier protein LolA [Ectothiorhodospiraceae bacterium BW-2]
MARIIAMIIVVWVTTIGAATAAESRQRLEQFLDDLTTLRAEIVQTVLNPRMELIEESLGQLILHRPGRFRLDYYHPYELSYIADGESIWIYDKDLEQVSVKPQQDALGSTPALLLSGQEPLNHSFTVEEIGEQNGFFWLNLYPKQSDASFNTIRLAIEGQTLRAIEMIDGFGQTTRLLLQKVERNPVLERHLFQFQPPEGVDVIGEVP